MKKQILQLLREAGDDFVSGQKLCEKAGVTRQAVWKNMTQLKEYGYEIESVPNKGYRLVASPDKMYGPDIESRLSEQCFCKKVEYHDVIDSTNTRAKQLAEAGEPEGTLVVADEQQAGKGRRGRNWNSVSGVGIYMSLIVRPSLNPAKASGMTLVAALAVAKGIAQACHVDTKIKWPNDIVLNGKKLCGILTEMSAEMDYIHYAVVGIGINANATKFQEEIKDKATSVFMETGEKADRQAIIAASMEAFSEYYSQYIKTGDLSLLLDEYNSLLANKDKEVQVLYGMLEDANPEKTDTGVAVGIDKDGALLVETNQGTKRIVSGEVSVRGLYGYV